MMDKGKKTARGAGGRLIAAAMLAGLVVCGCGGSIKSLPVPTGVEEAVCNGAAELCGRRYDEVVFPATHNSMSNLEEGWTAANQDFGMERQLRDGIRGFYLDTHYYEGKAYLCHGYCDIGREKLPDGLTKIKRFMDDNPDEVVTIVFESYVSEADTAGAFDEAGLTEFAHAQEKGKAWPTLGEMIKSGKRLVVFSSSPRNPGRGWYHYEWDYTWSSPYSFQNAGQFNCRVDRGSKANAVFEVPNFITDPLANRYRAEEVNSNPQFINRMKACMAESGRLPNLVSVDFYNLGDLFDVVDELNGL